MKKIKLSNITIDLDIWEELKVKDLRKIQPIMTNQKQGEEIELIINIIKCFSNDENIEEIINNLNMDDFTFLSQEITKIITPSKKKWWDNKKL